MTWLTIAMGKPHTGLILGKYRTGWGRGDCMVLYTVADFCQFVSQEDL